MSYELLYKHQLALILTTSILDPLAGAVRVWGERKTAQKSQRTLFRVLI